MAFTGLINKPPFVFDIVFATLLTSLAYVILSLKIFFFLDDYHKRPYYNNNRYQRRI